MGVLNEKRCKNLENTFEVHYYNFIIDYILLFYFNFLYDLYDA